MAQKAFLSAEGIFNDISWKFLDLPNSETFKNPV